MILTSQQVKRMTVAAGATAAVTVAMTGAATAATVTQAAPVKSAAQAAPNACTSSVGQAQMCW